MKHIHPINPGSGDEAGVKRCLLTASWALLTSVLFMIKQMAVVHTITATMTWMAAASAL